MPSNSRPDRKVVSSPYLHKLQRRHFLLFDILPILGAVFAIALLWWRRPTATDLILFFTLWAFTGFSLSIGYHRLFTHRSFKTTLPVRVLLTAFGNMAARSTMITWTAQHRRHHELADHAGDVHSPNLHGHTFLGRLRGLWYSHFTWMLEHDYPNVAYYVPDLIADRPVFATDRLYYWWIAIGMAAPALIGGLVSRSWMGALTGFLWGGVLRQFVVAQQVSALNSLTHMFGSRPFKMRDNNSANNALFGLITWGEGWHNNHHAFPSSANFGFQWYQIDPSYWMIRLMEWTGLAWDVRRPERERIVARRNKLEQEYAQSGGVREFGLGAAPAATASLEN